MNRDFFSREPTAPICAWNDDAVERITINNPAAVPEVSDRFAHEDRNTFSTARFGSRQGLHLRIASPRLAGHASSVFRRVLPEWRSRPSKHRAPSPPSKFRDRGALPGQALALTTVEAGNPLFV